MKICKKSLLCIKLWMGKAKRNRGMTYVELIVVLSIFAVMSTVMFFNYGDFQEKVDIRNLANDVALQIVQAQNSSLSGLLPPIVYITTESWKPSYGVYFDNTKPTQFIYFADLDAVGIPQNGIFNGSTSGCTGECLNNITITKGNKISKLEVVGAGCPVASPNDNLTILFKRPDSGASIKYNNLDLPLSCVSFYVQITVSSPKNVSSIIKFYPSGRVQIN